MNNSMEKLQKLLGEIESDSQKEAETLISEARKKADEGVSAKRESLKAKFESETSRVTEDFRSSEKKRVSEKHFYEERKSLVYRGELIGRFFGEMERELRGAAESSGYESYLKRCAGKARSYFPQGAELTAYCRREDIPAVRKALLPDIANVEEERGIRIGGVIFRCAGQSASVDFTFDTALEQEREKFASVTELQL